MAPTEVEVKFEMSAFSVLFWQLSMCFGCTDIRRQLVVRLLRIHDRNASNFSKHPFGQNICLGNQVVSSQHGLKGRWLNI